MEPNKESVKGKRKPIISKYENT